MNTRLEQLKALTAQFDANIDQYKSAAYDEANTRTDFIDRFFELLDWDIANKQGFSEAYREVVREDKVIIEGKTKAPDYSFRIGGIVKFFEEAKKPSVNIKEAGEPAFQLRRYGWTKKLPLSILTNFAEFAVYDTRIEPNIKDSAGTARIFYCTYKEYEQHFDFLYNTFSKNAILKGSFDRYVEENKNKKGTLEVDESLLSVIEAWRMELAKNIALRNPAISIYNLNTSVQKIIDRIIFLRIAEDKGIEDENLLLSVAKTNSIYEKLILIFKKADIKYNSGLFLNIDWIDKLNIDDKVLSNIIVNLYYPCPYEFSVLPIEILGSIYERFLGKTIRFRGVKGGHTAVIEEKPEVRKAGGVFYTPQYIAGYITLNTVCEKIKNKSPEEIAALKIYDPACGSGSILVAAYQHLLQYHLDYYTQKENTKTALKKEKIYEAGFKTYKLTIAEKQRILTNNIFGVDIDPQAVEVTKLSLYLKLLENEGKEANERLFTYSDLTLLPSLEENIKCGNSLVGTDFYAQGNLDLDDEARIKVNCFDWEREFPQIFKLGGFDVVIGNPPYGADLLEAEKQYLINKYQLPISIADTYLMFIKKSENLTKENGLFSFIIPSTWLYMPQYNFFRQFMIKTKNILEIQLFRKSVFLQAVVETCTIVINNSAPNDKTNYHYKEIKGDPCSFDCNEIIKKQFEILNDEEYNLILSGETEESLFNKIKDKKSLLGDIAQIVCGLTPYRLGKGKPVQTKKIVETRCFDADSKKDNTYRRYLMGRDFNKYTWCIEKNRWISYGDWLAEPRYAAPFNEEKKIIIRQTSDRLIAHLDTMKYLNLKNVHNLKIIKDNYSYEFLLGILNSKLLDWWYQKLIPEKGRVFAEVKVVNLKKLPIPALDLSDKTDKAAHDNLVSLVDTMLALKQKEAAEPNADMKKIISRQIDGVDSAIDTAVYALYGLTAEEIKVVEGN